MTGLGKWGLAGVPHRGWACTEMYDAGDDLITCEMCETQEVRYVHIMTHPDYQGGLECGCVCAGNMERDYIAALSTVSTRGTK
jgi:hypothetical protein